VIVSREIEVPVEMKGLSSLAATLFFWNKDHVGQSLIDRESKSESYQKNVKKVNAASENSFLTC
jgi:hypothetical protein